MLIDTQRIEDFLKTHSCHIINEEKTLEDKVTYPDFTTNRYESVFKQLQTDIEVEKTYDALEDVLFVENKDGDLVLAGPYEFTINEKIYSYEAGTPREPIWKDMFNLHSKGAEFTYSTEYEDVNYETVERNNNKETPYMNILNNQDLKKKYDSGEIKIPDNIMTKYMNGKAVFVIDNEEERDILAYNIARFPYTGIIPEYNSNNPYWFSWFRNNDIACSNFTTIPFEFKFMLFTDFSVILEQSKYKSMCFKDKKIAEYGYEFNDGDQIWSDTTEIYKTDNDNLFIKKYEDGYNEKVKYSTISLNNLIKEIQQHKKDKGKSRRGGCFIVKDIPNEYYKIGEKNIELDIPSNNEKHNTKALLSQAEYIGREDIEHKLEAGEECDEDMTSILYFRLPKDNPYITEAYEKETVEAAKEVGLKIIFPYKKLNPASGEAYLTADVDGDAFKLDTLINLKPEDINKLITNSYITNFCNGDIAIKINSQEELDILLSQLQNKDVKAPVYIHYNSRFPYFYIDRISVRLKANHNFNNINSVHCIEHCYNFSDLIDKDKQDNKQEDEPVIDLD